jgi:hypothetical protein
LNLCGFRGFESHPHRQNKIGSSGPITIADATKVFLSNREGAKITQTTLRKYRTFTKQLTNGFCGVARPSTYSMAAGISALGQRESCWSDKDIGP